MHRCMTRHAVLDTRRVHDTACRADMDPACRVGALLPARWPPYSLWMQLTRFIPIK